MSWILSIKTMEMAEGTEVTVQHFINIIQQDNNSYHMRTFLKLVLLLVLLPMAITYKLSSDRSKTQVDDRVKVDLYYESLCGESKQFLLNSLKTAANTKDFWKICDFKLYPYGNAKRVADRDSWDITCQHGVNECILNTIHSCALAYNDYYKQALPFILCLEEDTTNWMAQGKTCAKKYGIVWDALMYCETTNSGINEQVKMAEATEALVPPHTYTPWIVVNGSHTLPSENAVIANMVRYVCSVYTGSERIAACE